MDQKLRVVYLVGTSHCGSTLLSTLASSHPEIFSTSETGLSRESEANPAGFICSCGSPITECALWEEITAKVRARGLSFSVENWTNAYHYHNRYAYSALTTYRGKQWGRLQQFADRWLPRHRGKMRLADKVNLAIIQESLTWSGKPVFFDGTKVLRRLQRFLQMPELDVRVLRIYRDPRAYVESMKKFQVSAREAATHWLRYQQTADELLESVPQDRVLPLHFEQFCQHPQQAYCQMQEFMQVACHDIPGKIVPREHHIMGNDVRLVESMYIRFNERWRTTLSATEMTETLRIAEPVAERLGYQA